ncbi:MAG TPA: hypothetical protein VE093_05130 [Polyangiaceae bacterium]|nr:hypothetical protein [Polyangiaceae bacterium]
MSSFSPDEPRDPVTAPAPPTTRTMSPPELLDREAPDSAGKVVLEHVRPDVSLSRFVGPRADEAYWRGRVDELRANGDVEGELGASIELSRLLASRGTDLDTAVSLAVRALEIADDAGLRTDLAGWLVGLGQPAQAAEALRGLMAEARPAESARILVKTAVLLARANDPAGAAEALRDASELDPNQAMASELSGTLAAWAPEAVTPEWAAASFLEAARRREAANEKDAAFEDRLRAFEIAPHDEASAAALAETIAARGRPAASDEILRWHAAALSEIDPGRARAIHIERALTGREGADSASSIGALLDAGLDGDIESEAAAEVDQILARAGLSEVLAARLAVRAEREPAEARAATFQALAELYAGPLGRSEEANEAWLEVLTSDPGNAAALRALKEHAAKHQDETALAEAVVRLGEGVSRTAPPEELAPRAVALKELIPIVQKGLGDPALSSWAEQRLAIAGRRPDAAGEGAMGRPARTQSIMMFRVDPDADDAMAAAEALDSAATPEARIAALRRLARIYRGRPHVRAEYLDVLSELARALPSERAFTVALERMTSRTGELDPIEGVMRARLHENPPRDELVKARMWLGTLARRRGDEARALEEMAPLLVEAPEHRLAIGAVVVAAARVGDAARRAAALVLLANGLPGPIRAVLLAVAAELYATVGADEIGQQTAELAMEADPSSPRAVATLAMLTGGMDPRAAALTLERAINAIASTGFLCEQLAGALEAFGDAQLALAWTQRWVALRPGCPRAIAALVRRATVLNEPVKLAEALGWVLAQPKPLADIEGLLEAALVALFPIDRPRALTLARRSLDVLGPTLPSLRMQLLSIADKAGDQAFAIAVLERWLAVETLEEQVVDLVLELCRRRLLARDLDGAARELVRAIEHGADPMHVLERADAIDEAAHERGAHQSSDRLVSLAAARARALLAMGPELRLEASDAWRKLGSLLWDVAADHRGADAAFFLASQLAPEGGPAIYAQDIREFVGPEQAVEVLRTRADQMVSEEEAPARAALLIEAANIASTCGLHEEALAAAEAAIAIDPRRADAIVLVERSAHVAGGVVVLDHCYQCLADAALGCYGRRSAHYRAARQLEKRGEEKLALRHAIACFEAVPGTGTVFALMSRLAERTGDVIDVVRALQRIAAKSDPNARAEWYKRAAAIAGSTEDGALTRFDMLLSAMNARPDPATVELMGASIRQFIALTGETEMAAMRFERAVKAMLGKLEGPDGARAAIALARVAFGPLGAIGTGIAALERAMMVDGDIEEFETLVNHVPTLARDPDLSERFLRSVRAEADKPYSSVGAGLLRVASRLAAALGQETASAALLIHAAKRDQTDDELVSEAHAVVHDLGDITLLRALDEAVPVRYRLMALLEVADRRGREGADADAIIALERALVTGVLKGEERDRVALRLRHLLGMTRRNADIEALLRTELQRDDLTPPMRLRLARDLAGILALRADHRGALDLFASAVRGTAVDAPILDELHRLGRRVPESERHVQVLRDLAHHAPDDATRALLLCELAPLLEELGDRDAAVASYRAIAQINPSDQTAIDGLERDANERADHEALAELLRERIEAAPPDQRRPLRLRRAAALEQRLGRLEDACAELEALLTEAPDDKSALRFLADIFERLSAPLRAAPLLRKLGDLATPTDEKADYGLRAASSFLAGGDIASAKAALDAVAPIAARESVIELRGKIARQEGDFLGLAQALDQLSSASSEPAPRRAEMLLEASAAAGAAGDDALAMELARRALKMAPTHPAAILEARRLEYRARGAGTPRDAQAAVDDLGRVTEGLSREQRDLHAFLLAEALDAIQGKGAGTRELLRRREELGSSPLILLGLAERLVRNKKFKASVPLFEAALAGNLHGVRSRGRVAIAGADAAVTAGDFESAARLLNLAASEPDTRALAQRRQAELTTARNDPATSRSATDESAASSTTSPPPISGSSLSTPSPGSGFPVSLAPRSLTPPSSRVVFAGHSPEEIALYLELVGGSFDAGEKLLALYETKEIERSHDILAVRKHQAALLPGDRTALERLRDAATLDKNLPYAQAIEHILQGFTESGTSPPPPPLSFQRETPDLLKPLLFGPTPAPVHEALAIVWETGMYRRDIAQSGLTGALRVQPAIGTVLGDLWGSLTRVLGLLRTSLFLPRAGAPAAPKTRHALDAPGPLSAHVALLSPPAVVVTGDAARETPELAFLLGSMLAGSMPEHVLVNGLPEDSLRSLLSAILAAFGPLEGSPQRDPATVRLGENLWQLIPPRAARRLQELCADPARLSEDAALSGTRRIMRRAGLFAAGDLPVAVRMTVAELSLTLDTPLTEPEGLAAACRAHPALADLVRLATSSEYADARWQPAASPVLRRSDAATASRSRIGA